MPKRKRKRTRIKPGPILVLAVVFVFITGILYSPLTSLSKTTVIGAMPGDQAAIQDTLNSLNNVPWIMAATHDIRRIETDVQRIEAVDHATYSQNIFGRGYLRVVYRVPIARVRGETPIGLDATGVMFKTDRLPDDLPLVMRPDSAKDLPMSIASGFPSASVADLAVKAKQLDPHEKLTIWFNKEGALCLNMGSGLVILGSSDDLDEKLHSLKEFMDDEPGLLAKLEKLTLTEPTRPVKTYKKSRE